MPSKPSRPKTNKRSKAPSVLPWDEAIALALPKLAEAAGVGEREVHRLRHGIWFMLFSLLCNPSSFRPSPSTINGRLGAIELAARRLVTLLREPWVAREMQLHEEREVRIQSFASREIPRPTTTAEVLTHMNTVAERNRVVRCDIAAVDRLRERSSEMRRSRGRRNPPGALNPSKQYVANCALNWWTLLGRDERRSKEFIAFADQVYRIAGFRLKAGAVREQLNAALRRRRSGAPTKERSLQ